MESLPLREGEEEAGEAELALPQRAPGDTNSSTGTRSPA